MTGLTAEMIDAMVGAGLTAEQMAAVVKAQLSAQASADEARRAAKRELAAERQRRKRERDRQNVTDVTRDSALHGVTERDIPSPKANVSPTPPLKTQPSTLPPSDPKGSSSPTAKTKSARRLPEDWRPSAEEQGYGQELGLSVGEIDTMAEDMRLWAKAEGASKVDWSATFKNWMRREVRRPRLSNQARPPPTQSLRRPTGADLFTELAREADDELRRKHHGNGLRNGPTIEGAHARNCEPLEPDWPVRERP